MLTQIGTELWAFPYDVYMPGRVHFPCRAVVARLPDGGLWLHSPGPIDDALAKDIEALGKVTALVSPSLMHHVYLGAAAARWPQAQVWAPPGLEKKRPDLQIHHTLGEQVPPAWAPVLDIVPLHGSPATNETLFLHRPSASLLCTDFVFNIRRWNTPQTALVLWLVGAKGRLAQSRSWRLLTKDRVAMAESARAVLRLDFQRVVPAHGDIAEGVGPRQLEPLLAWMLSAAPARLSA